MKTVAASEEARRQARKDLRSKIKLEKDFIRKLTRLNNQIVRKMMIEFANKGIVLNAREFEDELAALLENQYSRAQKVFDDQIRDVLPKDLESNGIEDAAIALALGLFFADRKISQSQIITRTNQKDIIKSIVQADEILQDAADVGEIVTNREVAKNAGTLLRRKLKGRTRTIAATEVQVAAETSKAVETAVLTRNQLSLPRFEFRFSVPQLPLGLPPPELEKEWVTSGDEKVRRKSTGKFSHVKADGQKVKISESFIVSNEFLRIPGDTSQGASLGNVINCRCASVRDKRGVLNARKAIFEAETQLELETEVALPEFGFS